VEPARFKRRCADILGSPSSYDRALIERCQMISMR
jgi:hypothetical protein